MTETRQAGGVGGAEGLARALRERARSAATAVLREGLEEIDERHGRGVADEVAGLIDVGRVFEGLVEREMPAGENREPGEGGYAREGRGNPLTNAGYEAYDGRDGSGGSVAREDRAAYEGREGRGGPVVRDSRDASGGRAGFEGHEGRGGRAGFEGRESHEGRERPAARRGRTGRGNHDEDDEPWEFKPLTSL
ncbi:hypothetical protein VSH64_08280 [Amycolatopsis rhabdoformis]|uniref:Uncharacterized protein n=1 Tax=Amycolatopsis rhabdoformis TaxID=1448059 RepID=A0ABZ1IEJ7_9PSEU|nr:hypothetical protein [Amycolatopsis rhabdoformis]WSE32103.1 hypothetical protein VSH64_08280 [Amycolatopsis rhabdoformis]